MGIDGLKKYQRRHIQGPFDSLPSHLRITAVRWLEHFRKRWEKDLPRWRLAILIGQAKRLALNPPTPEWGRSMHGKRVGMQFKESTGSAGTIRLKRPRAFAS
jgi:hypothetical protein